MTLREGGTGPEVQHRQTHMAAIVLAVVGGQGLRKELTPVRYTVMGTTEVFLINVW